MQKCPYPGCHYVAAHIILKSHAREHGYDSVKALTKEHGRITEPAQRIEQLKHAKEHTAMVTDYNFNNIESALARLKRKRK